jgi:cell division ATPase FtsA
MQEKRKEGYNMGAKKAKLNLDFGYNGVSMNFAIANDIQSRDGVESEWSVGAHGFNADEFEDFPGIAQKRIDENRVKSIASCIERNIIEWQRVQGCDFDSLMEVTISANFFEVLFSPFSFKFARPTVITEEVMKEIEDCKQSEKMFQTPIPGEKIRFFTSPYFTIFDDKEDTVRVLNPVGSKTKSLGFDAYFIIKHPMFSRLLEIMKDKDEIIRVSLSCEKEFRALANKKEKEGKTALIHITDTFSEFSVWNKSDLKYLNKKDAGLRELKEILWRLCLFYHKNPKLTEHDFEFRQNSDYMQKFYNMVKNTEISDDSKELLSADDCFDLLEGASCVFDDENEDSSRYGRYGLPGKNRAKTRLTISSYVLCYFTREVMRNLFMEIKRTMYNDNFCKPDLIILECSLPLKGIEKLANEIFEIPTRKALVKWDGEVRGDLSSSAVGALQSLIAGEERKERKTAIENKKKTSKFDFFRFFSKAS